MKNSRKPDKWKEKFLKTIKIADTPPLNKEGFWKRKAVQEPDIEQHKA